MSSVGWYTADKLSQGNTNVDWFVVLPSSIDNNTGIEQGAVRQIKSKYFPKYTGNSKSIIVGLNAIGANSSFSYRNRIASVNNLSTYINKDYQNNVMLSLLKKGKLKNPESLS